MADAKRSELVNAAKTLNELLGIEPPIDDTLKPKTLTKKLLIAAELLEPTDELPDDAKDTLTKIGAFADAEPEKEEASEKGDVDIHALLAGATKLAAIKQIVTDHPEMFGDLPNRLNEFKGLHGPKQLKTAIAEIIGGAPAVEGGKEPAKKEKAPKKPKKGKAPKTDMPKMSRQGSIFAAVRKECEKGATRKEIAESANAIYANNGGKRLENLNHMSNVLNSTISTLIEFSVLEEFGGKLKFTVSQKV